MFSFVQTYIKFSKYNVLVAKKLCLAVVKIVFALRKHSVYDVYTYNLPLS